MACHDGHFAPGHFTDEYVNSNSDDIEAAASGVSSSDFVGANEDELDTKSSEH